MRNPKITNFFREEDVAILKKLVKNKEEIILLVAANTTCEAVTRELMCKWGQISQVSFAQKTLSLEEVKSMTETVAELRDARIFIMPVGDGK